MQCWIVNILAQSITVLELQGDTYVEHGICTHGERATSKFVEGFGVNVDDVLDAT